MHPTTSLRLYALLLALCLLWAACGCPLTLQEWSQLPITLRQIAWRAPSHALLLWRNWLLAPPKATSSAFLAAWQAMDGQALHVWDSTAGAAIDLPLETYVLGVVAAEMPASYAPAALQCQAVAARTRAVSTCLALGGNGCRSHPGYDVCTDSDCCQGYQSPSERQARWGSSTGAYEARIAAAVQQSAGQILTWDGLPIETLYHASSGGITEDAAAVFAQDVPYLVSVASPGEEFYAGYEARITFTTSEAAALLCAAFPGCGLAADDLAGQLRLLSSTASGRIDRVLVGNCEVSGAAFRQALGLRSTLCTWEADGNSIVFTTRGYGHGVGMSQAGAQAMALEGYGCAAILAHYYPDTCLTALPEV